MSVADLFDRSSESRHSHRMSVYQVRSQFRLSVGMTIIFAIGFCGLLILKSDRASTAGQLRPVKTISYSIIEPGGNDNLREFSKNAFELPNQELIL